MLTWRMKKWKKNGNENGEEEEFWEFWKESWKAEICIVTFRFFRILVNCKESPTPKKKNPQPGPSNWSKRPPSN